MPMLYAKRNGREGMTERTNDFRTLTRMKFQMTSNFSCATHKIPKAIATTTARQAKLANEIPTARIFRASMLANEPNIAQIMDEIHHVCCSRSSFICPHAGLLNWVFDVIGIGLRMADTLYAHNDSNRTDFVRRINLIDFFLVPVTRNHFMMRPSIEAIRNLILLFCINSWYILIAHTHTVVNRSNDSDSNRPAPIYTVN